VWRERARGPIGEGDRNETLSKLAGHLLRRRIDPYVTLDLLHCWNACVCVPPLDTEEVTATIESIAQREMNRRGRHHG
jgi:hypothetical protein